MITWSSWHQAQSIHPKSFTCGFCGDKVGSSHGYYYSPSPVISIYICTSCGCPTFFNDEQYPGPLIGRNIEKLPRDVAEVYDEIRDSIKQSNNTAALLLGRKLIMHLAVNVAKAKEGESFVDYINHLKEAGYIPPNGQQWIEYIKELGNEKNHELKLGTKEEAEKILKFIEVLLIFIYEFASSEGAEKKS